jgi:hypothetical protein
VVRVEGGIGKLTVPPKGKEIYLGPTGMSKSAHFLTTVSRLLFLVLKPSHT